VVIGILTVRGNRFKSVLTKPRMDRLEALHYRKRRGQEEGI